MNIKTVAICHYEHVIGGGEMLFYNYARMLIRAGFHVILVDWVDGTIATWLKRDGLPFRLECYEVNARVDIKDADLLIMNNTCMPNLARWHISSTCRFLFVEIYKGIWESRSNSFLSRIFKRARLIFVQYLISRNGFAVLERDSVDYAIKNQMKNTEQIRILPIPVRDVDQPFNTHPARVSSSILQVSTVARSSDNKFYPVIWIANELVKLERSHHISIVTHNVPKVLSLFERHYKGDMANISCVSTLEAQALDAFLAKSSDLHIAMGTAALEGGKLGIPTLIIDDTQEWPYPDNAKVRWLHENECANLGRNVYESIRDGCHGLTIKDALMDLDVNYLAISSATTKYVKEFHSYESVARQLMDAIMHSKVNVWSIRRLISYRVFNAFNTLLGLVHPYSR